MQVLEVKVGDVGVAAEVVQGHVTLAATVALWGNVAAHRFSRRWLLVGAGAAGLIGTGVIRLPVAAIDVDPDNLRRRILAATPPYVGYCESTGRLTLPEIPQLESVIALFTGTTRIRAFVAGADLWRVDELTSAGERDTYGADGAESVWDFGADEVTRVRGPASLRLPRAGDLLPPDLARRLLALAPTDPVTALPARRIAGRTAAGLRLAPADPDTTVGRVDVWADPATALPLRVEVAARTGPTLLLTELLEVADRAPDPADLTPTVPPGAGRVTARVADVSGALRVLDAGPTPDRLAGRNQVLLSGRPSTGAGIHTAELPGVGLYGSGLAGFVLLPLSHGVAEPAVDGVTAAGGTPIQVPVGRAVRVATPLLSVAIWERWRGSALLIGTVAPEVLEQALLDLAGRGRT